jgi:CheY-like chemotaxis protein
MAKKNNLRVLVVEDERFLSNAYKMILEKSGFTVDVAFDGNEAIEILEKDTPDVILLDLKMPNLDGIGFLKKYNPKDKHPEVKIVLFSNFDLQQEIDEAYSLGIDKYLLKAWASPQDLVKIVQDITKT